MQRTPAGILGPALLLVAVSAFGSAPMSRGMGYFAFGLNHLETGDFQARLDRTGLGYPLQPRNFATVGGGGLFCARGLVVGAEGFVLLGPGRTGGGYRTSLTGALGVFHVGYAIVNTDTLTLYPLLGFGAGAMTWKVRRDFVPASFEDAIREPESGSALFNASFFLQASLGADYWIKLGAPGSAAGSLVVGLRLGYGYSPFGDNWEIQMYDRTHELEGAPELGQTGPFLRVVLGWGAVSRRRS
jgi:hypothetical protein